VRQLLGRVLVKALSQDPPLVDIVNHLPQDFDWMSEITESLDHACHKGLTEVVELLLMRGDEVDDSSGYLPLYFACRRGHIAVARLLIEHGFTVTPGYSWRSKGPWDRSALHAAFEGGYPDVAMLLLENGAGVKCNGWEMVKALHIACTLYPRRKEMNTISTTPSQYASMAATWYEDIVGVKPTVRACSTARVALVALLVAEGADVNMLDGGGMSLMSLACRHGLVGVAELLICHGEDINLALGRSNKTAMSFACI
jgi:ankyrin repeat protein